MSGWRRGVRGTMALLRRRRAESELEDELRHYFDAAVDRAMAAGMSRKGAERAARIAMGSAAAVKDEVRDVGWEVRVETMWRDIRYAARALRRSGGFAPAAILTLAIGLGAATAIFTIVYSVLLRPLPYPDPERIVQLWERGASGGRMAVSDPNYRDIRDMSRTFAGLTQYATGDASVVVNGDALLARMALVSDEFFEVMGVRPMLGRTFRPEERHFGSLPLVIVSERFWRQQLGANAELSALSLWYRGPTRAGGRRHASRVCIPGCHRPLGFSGAMAGALIRTDRTDGHGDGPIASGRVTRAGAAGNKCNRPPAQGTVPAATRPRLTRHSFSSRRPSSVTCGLCF